MIETEENSTIRRVVIPSEYGDTKPFGRVVYFILDQSVSTTDIQINECSGSYAAIPDSNTDGKRVRSFIERKVCAFHKRVQRLDAGNQQERLFSLVYNHVNRLLWAGKFEEVDALLRGLKTDDISSGAAVAFLGYTSQTTETELPSRSIFYQRAYNTAIARHGEATAKSFFGCLK